MQKIKPQIRYQKKPVYTMVATSSRRAVHGGCRRTEANPWLESICRSGKDSWVVKVAIPYRMQAALPADEGCAVCASSFYQDWLPDQPYTCCIAGRMLEVYHYRQRYFRKSVKMVMELWFCLEPKVKE